MIDVAPVPDWHSDAACAGTDGDAFFPEQGGTVAAAKRVCAGCMVAEACLQYALDNQEKFGIWGGLTEDERRLYRGRQRRRQRHGAVAA